MSKIQKIIDSVHETYQTLINTLEKIKEVEGVSFCTETTGVFFEDLNTYREVINKVNEISAAVEDSLSLYDYFVSRGRLMFRYEASRDHLAHFIIGCKDLEGALKVIGCKIETYKSEEIIEEVVCEAKQ